MQVREFDLRTIDKMLPCPFCGGEAELDTAQNYRAINGHFGNRVVVYCADCGADQGTCVEDVPDIHPNEVIERWNKRAALPPRELLREALSALAEIARDDVGGLQAIYEEHEFDPRDHSKDTCVAKMKAWMEDEATYFMGPIRYRRERARAAADKIRAALEQQQKGEKL